MNTVNAIELAQQFQTAIKNSRAVRPLTEGLAKFSLDEAYAVQKAGLEIQTADGAKLAGYKMGLTSRAKQADVKVFEPIRGYLLSSGEVTKGDTVDMRRYIHPRTEPEVAIILKSRVFGADVSLRDVLPAIGGVYPALEIIDSRFENFSFQLADVIADNCSGAGFMLGSLNMLNDLAKINLMGVLIRKNGEVVETGAPAAVLGDPLLSIVGLARSLAKEGKAIEPGQVILTGGITAAVPFAAGDSLEIVWPGETLAFRAR